MSRRSGNRFAKYDSGSGNDVSGADLGAAFPGPGHLCNLTYRRTGAVVANYDRNMTLCMPTLGRETVTPPRGDARGRNNFVAPRPPLRRGSAPSVGRPQRGLFGPVPTPKKNHRKCCRDLCIDKQPTLWQVLARYDSLHASPGPRDSDATSRRRTRPEQFCGPHVHEYAAVMPHHGFSQIESALIRAIRVKTMTERMNKNLRMNWS